MTYSVGIRIPHGGGVLFPFQKRKFDMPSGGARIGAGRKAGVKLPKIRKINVDEIMNAVGTGPDKLPLPFLLAMMHAPEETGIKLSERIQCAIAAAPYCHAKLASKDEKTDTRSTMQTQSDLASALRDLARIARLRESAPIIEGDILEPATAPDKMSASDQAPDKMSAQSVGPDKMSAHTEGLEGEILGVDDEGGEARE
jgi:hypothetical protein